MAYTNGSRRRIIATLAALAIAISSSASLSSRAQDNGQAGGSSALELEVEVGDFTYTLDARYPVNICIESFTNGVERNDVRYRLFVREGSEEGPFFNQVGIFEDSAAGFADTRAGQCYPLTGIING